MTASPGPAGRDEVVGALLRAAIELFSEHGVRSTSVRQIARAAGVNHGLVHHYFGSKHALLEASLDRLAGAHTELPVGGDGAAAASDRLVDRHWRILAFALLEGEDPSELQRSFPLFEKLVEDRRRAGGDERQIRLEVARAVATGLGWQMFRRLIVTGLGLDERDCAEVDRGIVEQMV